MKLQTSSIPDDFDDPRIDAEADKLRTEDDLWFLPSPIEGEPDDLPPGPRSETRETDVPDHWRAAEAVNAARLARVAGRLGALDGSVAQITRGIHLVNPAW